MSASTVNVKNISSSTSEKEIKDFFSFCGKISNIEVTPSGESKNATVTFEKETAAKTALLLDNTQLGNTQVQVTSASASNDDDGDQYTSNTERDSDELTQEEKPRARIAAEYIAHGYVLGDQAIQKAIDLDNKHGVSNRFLATLNSLDQKYHATDKAKSVDQSYGVSATASNILTGITSYFEKAAETPTGQKLVNFYSQGSKQVQDIHAEARRLADLKKQDSGNSVSKVPGTEKTTCKCGADPTNCPCETGKCACTGCEKSDVKKVSATSENTTCKCGGDTKVCGCAPGKCSCGDCPKAKTKPVAGTDKTTCNCGGDDKNCPCESGKCACNGCPK
ncbi:related to actin cytoskeleton protein (VIP1) [Rhynchosporium agropyri]|uniref:Related to actin cytoskeleton protein (VIP1) n=1 Tax=Rhynchosporium agropyri TaxID=914238 RepID=A0A1E1KW75_9HELO|nr:related to actin cytoskeleton protein (VIP1) [Rhynchosporium agropyri]